MLADSLYLQQPRRNTVALLGAACVFKISRSKQQRSVPDVNIRRGVPGGNHLSKCLDGKEEGRDDRNDFTTF